MATLRIRKNREGEPAYRELQWSDKTGRHTLNLGPVNVLSEKRANDILKAKQLELSTGAKILGIGSSSYAPTFGIYAREYLLWHQSEYPSSNYRIAQIIDQHFLPIWEHVRLDCITSHDAEQYKQDRRRDKAKAHTITKELRTLQAVLNKAVRDKRISENPIENVSSPRILDAKPHLFYEASQLKALYDACRVKVNGGFGPQPVELHAAIWKLMVNTGMRRGEGLHLLKKWIGREEIKIVSTGEERTKSGNWRAVPKTDGAAEALDRLKHAVDGDYVLPRTAPPLLSRAYLRDAARAGISGSLHTLRHTYISHLVRDTHIPMRTVQLWAGHSTIAVTENYSYLRDTANAKPALALNL
jgi:integrase